MLSHLVIKRGANTGAKFDLVNYPVTIGRDDSNTITLNDSEVSRFHIRIKKRGRLIILEDLESKNGCYVNGDRVVNSIIQSGDSIIIGNTELMLVTPADNVDFASEVLKFNMVIDQEHGIDGPISVTEKSDPTYLTPLQLNNSNIINKLADNVRSIRKIYDLQGNIMVIDNLDEACHAILKGICQLSPHISRCAAFVWSAPQHQLIPVATKQNKSSDASFRINKRALSQTLGLKQGITIKDEHSVADSRFRVILPMIHNNEVVCLFHIESEKTQKSFPIRQLESIQTLLSRCAPSFEAMLLRMEIDALMLGMVETVVATIEAKDTYTVGHSERVCKFSMAIADELKLNKDVKKMLMISSLCHDIGKIGIPDAILKKASILSREEYEEMKLHPTIGANIISHMPNAKKFLSGVKYHHEKWDGTGYPEGLAGENIPFFGRIVAVADVFDAMVSGRSYSGFIDESDAVEKIQKESDLFDPEIVKALVRAWDNGSITQRTSTLSEDRSEENETKTGLKIDPGIYDEDDS